MPTENQTSSAREIVGFYHANSSGKLDDFVNFCQEKAISIGVGHEKSENFGVWCVSIMHAMVNGTFVGGDEYRANVIGMGLAKMK